MAGQSDAEIRRVLATVVDPVGTFYRFSLAASLLHQVSANGDAEALCAAQRDGSGEGTE